MNNFPATSIDEQHLAEFNASAIAQDITKLNFRSWNPENENDLDYVFTQLVSEPEHRNNGTLAGHANEQLANTLQSGGWLFEGCKGISVKPNSPRTNSEAKTHLAFPYSRSFNVLASGLGQGVWSMPNTRYF